jgi:hypothetical protein
MTIENFDSELADFAEAVATTGLALAGIEGKRLFVVAFPEDAFRTLRSAFVKASREFGTESTASTLWALLDPFLDDPEPDPVECVSPPCPEEIQIEGSVLFGLDKLDDLLVGDLPKSWVEPKPPIDGLPEAGS